MGALEPDESDRHRPAVSPFSLIEAGADEGHARDYVVEARGLVKRYGPVIAAQCVDILV